MPVILSGRNQEATLDQVQAIEQHFHTRWRWFGISANQTGDDWALATGLTAFSADSGSGVFGAVIKVLGPDDTPIFAGHTLFDSGMILAATLQHTTPYVMQLIWGTGTSADAITAEQFTEVMLIKSTATGAAGGSPFPIRMLRIAVGTNVWARVKNATDTSTIEFFIGIHEYVR